jgi:hypothetical protein
LTTKTTSALPQVLLKKLGVTTTYEAPNIAQAREQVALFKPGLITLDINCRAVTGWISSARPRTK